MRLNSATYRLLGNCVFTIGLSLVGSLVFLSDGRILNITATAEGDTTLLCIKLFCWMMLLGFGWLLTVGGWKHHKNLRHAALMSLLALPMLLVIFSLLPESAPRWVRAMLAGLTMLAASRATDRIITRASL